MRLSVDIADTSELRGGLYWLLACFPRNGSSAGESGVGVLFTLGYIGCSGKHPVVTVSMPTGLWSGRVLLSWSQARCWTSLYNSSSSDWWAHWAFCVGVASTNKLLVCWGSYPLACTACCLLILLVQLDLGIVGVA